MNLIKLKCENCGATLKVNEDLEKIICNYCGNEIFLDDEASNISRIEKVKLKARKENYNQDKLEKSESDLYYDEKNYIEKMKNGKIKNWSVFLSAITFLFFLTGLEQGKIIPAIICLIQTGIFLYVYCICIEFVKESKRGMHKLLFLIGILWMFLFLFFL